MTSTHSVDPHQFLGIELNPRAAAVAELVLWIGYLQWHFRTRGQTLPEEPVLKKFKNIECRDAVLAWDGKPQPARDEAGEIITVWDRHSMKTDLLTGRDVPDETKRVPLLAYPNARPAKWPKADYIVGNPPFIGKLKVREDLGDGYAETLRDTYPEVPESADFVMYWWHKAAALVRKRAVRMFGLITTNSLRQTFNRRVLQQHLGELSITFAIPDHPWVDATAKDERKAAVRISMTVGRLGNHSGELRLIALEDSHDDGSSIVTFTVGTGRIAADLSIGANVSSVFALKSNDLVASTGLILGGRGFVINKNEAESLISRNHTSKLLLFPLRNGDDFTGAPRNLWVIDTSGWTDINLRREVPEIYQHLYNTVYPERQSNRDPRLRKNWWLFRRSNEQVRGAIDTLPRFIVTVETAKHRVFGFLDAGIKPEHAFVVFGLDDAFYIGVLSSKIHVAFALAAGGTLEDRPRYNKTRCFDPFPFPACDEVGKNRIRALGGELDAHRKRVQAQHPDLTLTGMYNVLEALRAGRALTAKEQMIHDRGLVSILRQLHDELDAAVAAAYGWPADLPDAEILTRLVALNAERAAEEAAGHIRWLRPAYQDPTGASTQIGLDLAIPDDVPAKTRVSKAKEPWPKTLTERVQAIERALQSAAAPVTAAMLAKQFARVKFDELTEILDTLAMLGRAHQEAGKFSA